MLSMVISCNTGRRGGGLTYVAIPLKNCDLEIQSAINIPSRPFPSARHLSLIPLPLLTSNPFCLPPQVVTAQPYLSEHLGQTSYSAPSPPNSYLVWSIISFLCCCWPLGLVAIIFSIQVNSCACDCMLLKSTTLSCINSSLHIRTSNCM